jgi:hypothetical protein
MSTNLYWKPPTEGRDLSDELKFKLRDQYQMPVVLNHSDLGFLKGLMVCEIKDAKILFNAIEEYGEVTVYEE